MDGIHVDIKVKDDGTQEVKKFDRAVKEAGDEAERSGKKGERGMDRMAAAAKRVSRAVNNIGGYLVRIAAIATAAASGGIGFLVKRGIDFNAQLESARVSLGVIYNDTKRAGRAMKELVDFAAHTPFQLGEVAAAAKILEAFGLGGRDNLRMVGDAAAAAQRPLEEVAMVFGRIKSGAFGEAFMRLAEMGLATRAALEGEGLQFDRSGAYVGTVDDAMAAVTRIMNRRFTGMMEQLSQTWSGKISTMKDAFSIMAGDLTRPLFEKLKPRIDQIAAAFDRIGKSAAGRVFFTKIAEIVDRIAGKIVEWLGNIPRIFQWVMAIWQGFEGLWASLVAGWKWVGNVASATIELIKFKLLGMGASAKAALSAGGPVEAGAAFINNMLNVNEMAKQAEKNLVAALTAPGLMATAEARMAEIKKFMRNGMNFFAPDQGDDLGAGPGLDAVQQQVSIHERMLNEIQALYDQFRAWQKELWSAYWQDMSDIAQSGFVDGVTNQILLSGEELKISMDNLWEQMKRSFVRATVQMATSWVVAKVKMQLTEQAIRKKALLDEIASAQASARATAPATGAFAGTAAAKYHAAYAAIPFVGPSLATGFIQAMNVQIAATKALNMAFRTGGLVPGGGAGIEDRTPIYVSGGEFVQPRSAVNQYGEAFMESVRTGTYVPGGGSSLSVTLVGVPPVTESEVEEALAPILERLNEQGRFKVA